MRCFQQDSCHILVVTTTAKVAIKRQYNWFWRFRVATLSLYFSDTDLPHWEAIDVIIGTDFYLDKLTFRWYLKLKSTNPTYAVQFHQLDSFEVFRQLLLLTVSWLCNQLYTYTPIHSHLQYIYVVSSRLPRQRVCCCVRWNSHVVRKATGFKIQTWTHAYLIDVREIYRPPSTFFGFH